MKLSEIVGVKFGNDINILNFKNENLKVIKNLTIIANTNSGWTAKLISYFRPKCPIVGLSPSIDTVRSLTLVYGVMPLLSEECQSTDGIVKMCLKEARQKLDLEHDNIVIITGGFPISNKNTNFMKIEVID